MDVFFGGGDIRLMVLGPTRMPYLFWFDYNKPNELPVPVPVWAFLVLVYIPIFFFPCSFDSGGRDTGTRELEPREELKQWTHRSGVALSVYM
jgi:hypothetical protein